MRKQSLEGREVSGRTPRLWLGPRGVGGAPPWAGRGVSGGEGKGQLLVGFIRTLSPNGRLRRADGRDGVKVEKSASMKFWFSFLFWWRAGEKERIWEAGGGEREG